jgi:hypothetical protein
MKKVLRVAFGAGCVLLVGCATNSSLTPDELAWKASMDSKMQAQREEARKMIGASVANPDGSGGFRAVDARYEIR